MTLLFGWLVLEGISDALLQRASPVGRWIAQQDSVAWIAIVWLIALAALRWAYVLIKVSGGANPSAVLLAGGAILFAAIATLLWRRARYG